MKGSIGVEGCENPHHCIFLGRCLKFCPFNSQTPNFKGLVEVEGDLTLTDGSCYGNSQLRYLLRSFSFDGWQCQAIAMSACAGLNWGRGRRSVPEARTMGEPPNTPQPEANVLSSDISLQPARNIHARIWSQLIALFP